MLVSLVCSLISVILLTAVLSFGIFVGYKSTIEILKMKGDLEESWPDGGSLEDGDGILYECEGCKAPSDVINCVIKDTEYFLCHDCMIMMGAKPLE